MALSPLTGATRAARAIEAILNTHKNLAAYCRKHPTVSYQTAHMWKHGRSEPSEDSLRLVAEHTGYTLRELMGEGMDAPRYQCPWPAWKEFEQTSQYRDASAAELRHLAAHPWRGEPSLADYLALYSLTVDPERRRKH